ncbi:MAG: VCBS repeat-containing protein [Betaproteobacteria bacterium]|nr:VCBS repeat-containing protein [Betaproteobacteria bacterium]
MRQRQISASTTWLAQERFTGSLFADVDRDGYPDLIVLPNPFTPTGLLFLNDRSGDFSRSPWIELPPGLYGSGWLVRVQNPDGTFVTPYPQSPGPSSIHLDSKAVDVNGDGYPDLVILQTQRQGEPPGNVYYRGGRIQILINQGGRGFVDETAARGAPGFEAPTNYDAYHSTLRVTDVDGDGFPDIIATRARANYEQHVFLNDGTGRFTRASLPGCPGRAPRRPLRRHRAADTDRQRAVSLSQWRGKAHALHAGRADLRNGCCADPGDDFGGGVLQREPRPLFRHSAGRGAGQPRRGVDTYAMDADRQGLQCLRVRSCEELAGVPLLHSAGAGRLALLRPRHDGVRFHRGEEPELRPRVASLHAPDPACRGGLSCRHGARVSGLQQPRRRQSPLHHRPRDARSDGRQRLARGGRRPRSRRHVCTAVTGAGDTGDRPR